MSVRNFCNMLWRPFYGWMDYFFLITVYGLLKNFYKHGKEWSLFFTLLCTLLNIPLDIYISYLYFFNKLHFFYKPALEVRLAIGGMTLASVAISIVFIWTVGKSLLIVTDGNRNSTTYESKRFNAVYPNGYGNGTHTIACTSTEVDSNEPDVEENLNDDQKRTVFQTFKLFFEAIYLLVASFGSIYLTYSYIISCSPIREPAAVAKLIIAGFFLPILLTISALQAVYTIHKRSKSSKRFRPTAILLSTCTIFTGIASIWLFTISFHTWNQVTAATPAVGLEYNQAEIGTSSVVLHQHSETIFIAKAADILSTQNLEVRFECTKKHEKIGILCEEINFFFQYIKDTQRVDYNYQIKHENHTPTEDKIPGDIHWSCNLCHEGMVIKGKNTGNDDISRKLKSCGTTPNWLYYTLAGYTVAVLIVYSAVLAKAIGKKQGQNPTTTERLPPESSEIQSIGIQCDDSYDDSALPTLRNLPRNKLPKLKELEIATAWKQKIMPGTNLLQTNGRNSLSSQPRIIRVPKGTALGLMRSEKKITG